MLTNLSIKNIAVIHFAEICPGSGLNVLTGETGAGKSMIIDSINAILGERTSREMIRYGENRAQMQALFEPENTDLDALLGELGFEMEDGTLLITRDITADGKNTCRLNGQLATNAMLKEIGQGLINIHGQQDSQALLSAVRHMDFLDDFAGPELAAVRTRFIEAYKRCQEIRRRSEALNMDERQKRQRMEMLAFQITEIEEAKLKSGEDEQLAAEKRLVANGAEVKGALSKACALLYDGDHTAYDTLSEAVKLLEVVAMYDQETAQAGQALLDMTYTLSDVAAQLRHKFQGLDFEEGRIEEIELRLDVIYRLKRKYAGSIEGILEFLQSCQRELEELEVGDVKLEKLKRDLEVAEAELEALGNELTGMRQSAAKVLETKILSELADLDMEKTKFMVKIEAVDAHSKGMDKVEFLLSANPGEPLKPLVKIASGGELARIMLALKSVLSDSDKTATLIFDEIDTGVSGRAAQKIAYKLAKISRKKQVICITHLAQIAAMADRHFLIEKQDMDGKASTSVKQLEGEQRKTEIARIIDGRAASAAALAHAGEMLKAAEEYKREGV